MSAPLVVNTKDGVCWTRRTATSSRIALYAPEGVCKCPEFVMATLPELAEHGIVGSADVLPVPVGPKPSERERLRAAFVAALDDAARTHPCPTLGDQIWSGCVHYDDAGRITGVGSCHSERRADAVLAVRDAEVEYLIQEVDRRQARVDEVERAHTFDTVALKRRVAELEAERHSTNEALDDAVQALRARQSCPCPPADPPHQVGCFFDGVPVSPPSERPVDGLTAAFMPVASLREDPHDSPLHHDWRIGRDLPELGGES